MNVSVEEISTVKKKVRVEVPKEAVSHELDHALSHLQKEIRLPGFRQGKVPLALLTKKYEASLHNEVLQHLLPEYCQKAMEKLGLSPIVYPQIQDIDFKKDAPLFFTAVVDVRPEITLGDYTGLTLPQKEVVVTESDIEQGLEMLRERQGYLESVAEDHSIVSSDYVTIDFIGEVNGKPLKGGKRKGSVVQVGSKTARPEIEEALLGKKNGDTVFADLLIPSDDPDKTVAGKTARFTIDIKEIKVKILPALDDEFAKDLGVASLVELRERVKSQWEQERAAAIKQDQKNLLVQKLVELHPIEAPQPMVEHEWESLPKELQASKESDPERFHLFEEIVTNKVKGALIISAIAEKEKIEVTDQELEMAIRQASQEMKMPYEKGKHEIMQNPNALRGLKGMIVQKKALEQVYSLARFEKVDRTPPAGIMPPAGGTPTATGTTTATGTSTEKGVLSLC